LALPFSIRPLNYLHLDDIERAKLDYFLWDLYQPQQQELEELQNRSTGEACAVHAQGVIQAAKVQRKAQEFFQKGIAVISLEEKPTCTKV
jgi:hypothetical protein